MTEAVPQDETPHSAPALKPYSDVEYVFEPHSPTVTSSGDYVEEVWARRRFAVALAQSELRGPRASTVLGEVWGVVDPLFQAAIYFFLITVIRGGQGGFSVQIKQLALIMSGLFLFSFSVTALAEGGRSITRNKGLMLNSTFPRALLPMASLYKGFLALVPAMIIYAVIHVAVGAPITSVLVMFPVVFLLQVLISAGLALILATLTVYIRDMSNILDYIMRILLFITPVIYPVKQLPSTLGLILRVNPLFSVFAAYQNIFGGKVPSGLDMLIAVFWATVLPIVGFRVFVSRERGFAMRL